MTRSAPRWLSDEEQAHWRSWIAATMLLTDRLGRDMLDGHDLSFADYEILVHLSESPDRRLRMSELATRTLSSRSRLSHQIDRMEKRGLVSRAHCDEDRRGTFAELTDHGWEVIVAAAPDHVASVRRHLLDPLGPRGFAELGRLCQRIVDNLDAPEGPGDGRVDL